MQVWLGTSGYSYTDWVGSFYPAGLQSGQMLGHYCRHFPLVELNFTFYRLPTASMLERLADQTPRGFQFLVKVPRTLSHDEESQDLPAFRLAVDELQRGGRLLGLLCQMPQASHQTAAHRAWVEHLAAELGDYRLAVEFRHRSWHQAEVPAWLKEHSLDLVAVDVPSLPSLYPRGLVKSGPRIYIRFHSRDAENWYRSDKERYDYDYSDAALTEWIDALRGAAGDSTTALLLFNNCQRSQAAANAARMRELLARLAPNLEVVKPFAPADSGPQQRLLFE
jgi:uncharacterized protein YecE (DUF72 family)